MGFALGVSVLGQIDGWMTLLLRPFNNISSMGMIMKDNDGGDNERLCAMESCLHLKDFRLQRVSNPGPLDQLAKA